MTDFEALERLLADEVYERENLEDDPLNIDGWLNDIDAEDATIEEMMENIVSDEENRTRILKMIEFLD
ncbi:hypothetical protein N9E09_00945 [bacterium]|jgi:hypothetical protein|nr:hypothetical protein [bacterium]